MVRHAAKAIMLVFALVLIGCATGNASQDAAIGKWIFMDTHADQMLQCIGDISINADATFTAIERCRTELNGLDADHSLGNNLTWKRLAPQIVLVNANGTIPILYIHFAGDNKSMTIQKLSFSNTPNGDNMPFAIGFKDVLGQGTLKYLDAIAH
jgi:hypothetical protein